MGLEVGRVTAFVTKPLLTAAAALAVAGGLGYGIVSAGTAHIVTAEAQLDANQWVEGLQRAVPGLPQQIAGNGPPPDIRAGIDAVRRSGEVNAFHVFDAKGNHRWTSADRALEYPASRLADIDPSLAQALASSVAHTVLKRMPDGRYMAYALVPVKDEQGTAGWIVAETDQKDRMAIHGSLLVKAVSLAGGLMIALPLLAFWLRSRERAETRQKLEWLSQRDQLTGLINRATFFKMAEQKMSAARIRQQPGALILCEARLSASVAQALGEDVQDHLIKTSANRLIALTSGRQTAAKVGRHTFAVCVENESDPVAILSFAKELTAKLGEVVEWQGQEVAVQAFAGIALSGRDGDTPEELMRSAGLALRTAEEQGTPGYGFFNPDVAKDMRREAAVQRAVSAAVANNAFRLDYQPVYNVRTGELNGFEALIRMTDPEIGNVSPGEFIPVAERIGLINAIGTWCLQEACRTAAEWPPHLMVAVNLSPSQFMSGSLLSDVRNALTQAQLPAYRLEVEITEGTLLNDSELVLGQLRMLRDMGVAVALDDFGTGYSSLGYLWKFPFSKLKIDRSFVQALDESPNAKGIIRSIIKLGHGLGLTVTAEGIETSKQLSALRDLGCDLAQGYLLDRPSRVADLAAIIMRNFANGLRRTRSQAEAGKSAA